jgi:hypothetical protein
VTRLVARRTTLLFGGGSSLGRHVCGWREFDKEVCTVEA